MTPSLGAFASCVSSTQILSYLLWGGVGDGDSSDICNLEDTTQYSDAIPTLSVHGLVPHGRAKTKA